ncbi:MAG: RrF2 family transcriptional regulator [Planctomycetota bacterium]
MFISQKCQYAVRAIFELAKHYGHGPVKIAEVAEAQSIPVRFLEVILSQLKQGDFVESRRGKRGGYLLALPPEAVTVGDVIRFVEGPFGPVECVTGEADRDCPLHERCVFLPMWRRAREAVSEVYDSTTFRDLLDEEQRMREDYVPSYAI